MFNIFVKENKLVVNELFKIEYSVSVPGNYYQRWILKSDSKGLFNQYY